MVWLGSQHALNIQFIKCCFRVSLLKKWFALISFFFLRDDLLLWGCLRLMLPLHVSLPCRRGWGAGEEVLETNTKTDDSPLLLSLLFPSDDFAHLILPLPSLMGDWSTHGCFIFLSFSCCSDETFSCDVDASCVFQSAFCCWVWVFSGVKIRESFF